MEMKKVLDRDEIFLTLIVWNSDQGHESTIAKLDLGKVIEVRTIFT